MGKINYEEEDLNYLIVTNEQVIARFDTDIDRDDCLAFLKEKYDDCKFVAVDED